MGKKDRNTPLRLPRKLKKDIIKVAGRDSFYRVMYIHYDLTVCKYR
jgi:hypothetical protein